MIYETPPARTTRPCPACPDGNVWARGGPTGRMCPTCNGHGWLHMDGSAEPRYVPPKKAKP